MISKLANYLRPEIEAVIRLNNITVRNLDTGEVASIDAPFSCSHVVADDLILLEHACKTAFKQASAGGWLSFPHVTVSVPGRKIHYVERKVILDALKDAGASEVQFDHSLNFCDDSSSARDAYVAKVTRDR